MTDNFRQEHKFSISTKDRDILKYKLRCGLRPDSHVGTDGTYFIRSLYFDDRNYKAYREKIDGVKDRSKFRIRYYNFDDSYIVLEKKERSGDLCRKTSQIISHAVADAMIAGMPSGGGSPLLDEFDMLRKQGLYPVVIADYIRAAYTFPVSNVRVTLDSDLRASVYTLDFFNRNLMTFPVFDENEALIELKFDEFAPQIVKELLEGVPKVKMAVSKYARCLAMIEE